MDDRTCFSIKTPYSDERIYCCVFGSQGIEFGINAYIGTDGVFFYNKVLSGEAVKNPVFALEMDAFTLLLEDKKTIEKSSFKRLQKSGVEYSDDKIPNIQRYSPGYYPRNLNGNETKIMICIIEQTIEVVKRIIIEPQLLYEKEDKIFTRLAEIKNDEIKWHDEYLELDDVLHTDSILYISPMQIANIKEECEIIDDEWHYGSFISPHPVKERNKEPYFPRVIFCVNANSGMILDSFLIKPNEKNENIQKQLANTFHKLGVIPKSVKAKPEKISFQLAAISHYLNFDFELDDDLPEVDSVIEHLVNMPN